MSSMTIPMGGAGGASGGGSFIQVYADAPQYIEGKYLRVSLDGTEIYADSIPTNVDALTLQITEAGTYTIGLYSSSSASTATESHTVLVDNLNASPSVHFGERIYKDTTSTGYYYTASDTALKTISNLSGASTATDRKVYIGTSTFTFNGPGIIRCTLTGSGTKDSGTSTYDSIGFEIYDANNNKVCSGDAMASSNGASFTFDSTYDRELSGSGLCTIKVYLEKHQNESLSNIYRVTNVKLVIKGTSNSYTYSVKGMIANSLKSIQQGSAVRGTTSIAVTVSVVNPSKSLLMYRQRDDEPWSFKKMVNPTSFTLSVNSAYATSWLLFEWY